MIQWFLEYRKMNNNNDNSFSNKGFIEIKNANCIFVCLPLCTIMQFPIGTVYTILPIFPISIYISKQKTYIILEKL